MGDKPDSGYVSDSFPTKNDVLCKNCGFLESFLGTEMTT